MGILAPAPGISRFAYAPHDDYWYSPGPAAASSAGVAVTPESALTFSTIYACTAVITDDIAKVPLQMFEDQGERGKRRAKEHPLDEKLGRRPNRYQTALEWRAMMTAFALLRKFAISEIRPGRRPLVDDEYVPLHPDLVHEETLRGDTRRYVYRDPLRGFEERQLRDDQVIVLRGRFGRSVLDFARESIGIALAQERATGQLFARGARVQAAILRDKPWPDPARENFRRALDEYSVSGQYSGRPLLLEDGMQWQSIQLNAKDAELIDARRFSNIQACQWFRVPPHKIFELERSTNNNIERQSIDYVTDSLLFWAENWEQVIWRDLIVAKGRFFAEHNLDGLLRGDTLSRYQAFALAIQWGWLTRNEIRALENKNPIAGADMLERPLNMEPVGQVDSGNVVALRGRLRLIASSAAARVIRREVAEMTKLAERSAGDVGGWRAGVEEFYGRHGEFVASALHIADSVATRYAQAQRDDLLASGLSAMETWLTDRVDTLTELAMQQEELEAAA